ncbi:substrate-binding domain-containing protein [uncultured Roseibium sp.]|uniref:substrate-binding domain-containing protein n=1 Tax=uncultured Roseibium sp. TaxID=1936171 RepID=UPI00261569CF|nr:substrate-binding domain-containing protein [uncultured Roseibium sp.]
MNLIRYAVLGAAMVAATGSASAMEVGDVIGALPPELQAEYENSSTPVGLPQVPKVAGDGALLWCHSESYQGNPWRVALTNELKRLVQGLVDEGKVSEFKMTDSNGDVGLEISNIRSLIDADCDIITSVPGSPTGLNAVVDAAAEAGIPFVTAASTVSSPNAVNVDSNYYKWGYDMARSLAEAIGGKGNVVMVEGIAGVSIVDQQRQGAQAAFAEYPDVKVVRMVNGNWTPSVTKSVILQTLATNPSPIDGVWTTGSETRVIAEAFAQAGRPVPFVTGSVTGDALGYWKANPDAFKFEGHAVLPQWMGQNLFRVSSRILAGQEPKLSTLMIPIPKVPMSSFDAWYADCMKPDSAEIFPVNPEDPVPSQVMNAYFGSSDLAPGWNYADVPGACN